MAVRRLALLAALALLTGGASGALAEDAGGCDAFKWSVARERSAFATPGLQTIEPGKPLPGIMDPAVVSLKPVAEAGFVRPPGRKPKDGTFGAVLKAPPIAVAGTYQITLSDDAWIDVIQDGREVRSSAVSAGAGCPVRKSVRFALRAGDATIEISGSAANSVKVEVLPAD